MQNNRKAKPKPFVVRAEFQKGNAGKGGKGAREDTPQWTAPEKPMREKEPHDEYGPSRFSNHLKLSDSPLVTHAYLPPIWNYKKNWTTCPTHTRGRKVERGKSWTIRMFSRLIQKKETNHRYSKYLSTTRGRGTSFAFGEWLHYSKERGE